MVEEQEQSTGAQYPQHLLQGAALVGDDAERQGTDHGVEGGVGEAQVLDNPDPVERWAIPTARLADLEERMALLREAREIVEQEMVRRHEQP